MQLRRVVITGLGALTPVGNSAPETWAALIAGKNGIEPITAFDATLFKTHFAGEVKNFNPELVIDRKEVRKMDRCSLSGWPMRRFRTAVWIWRKKTVVVLV